ncbi:hypothetical protein ACRAWD_09330 [Caulobacter segnis]
MQQSALQSHWPPLLTSGHVWIAWRTDSPSRPGAALGRRAPRPASSPWLKVAYPLAAAEIGADRRRRPIMAARLVRPRHSAELPAFGRLNALTARPATPWSRAIPMPSACHHHPMIVQVRPDRPGPDLSYPSP